MSVKKKNFDDADIISVDSDAHTSAPNITSEIERAAKIYIDREVVKRNATPLIKPLYSDCRKTQLQNIRPAIYKCFYYRKKIKPPVHRCRHFGNFQLNRDILTSDEHISYLAQPKKCICRVVYPRVRCRVVKRYLPNCTARIDSLATPNIRAIEYTWKNYCDKLTVRQLNSLSKYLLPEKNPEHTDIERAIMLVKEERYLKCIQREKLRKRALRIKKDIIKKRKCQIREIVWGIFEIMKDFLMNIHDVELEGDMKSLSHIILWNITQFASYKMPTPDSKEFLDKFLVNLAENITIWMEKFTTNFGFTPLYKQGLANEKPKQDYPRSPEDMMSRLPIDDYIPYAETDEVLSELEIGEEEEGMGYGDEYGSTNYESENQ